MLDRDDAATPREVARALGVPMNALGRELAAHEVSFAAAVNLCRTERVLGALEGRDVGSRQVGVVLAALA